MTSTPNDPKQDERPSETDHQETAEAVDDVELEDDDVALPGSPEFEDDHQLLTGKDADPDPGASAG